VLSELGALLLERVTSVQTAAIHQLAMAKPLAKRQRTRETKQKCTQTEKA